MGRPSRRRFALVLRICIRNRDAAKPERNIWIPLPLFFILALALDVFVCVSVHVISIVLPVFRKNRGKSAFQKQLPLLRAVTRLFFFTRLSYGAMRYGNALEIRAVDGGSGIVVSMG